MNALDLSINSLLFAVPLLHLLLSPYTKVEESFNIQAVHDILVYGTPTSDVHQRLSESYDHFAFPGAVPRTFLGAVLLSGASRPLIALAGFRHAQLVVRAVLGLFNSFCLLAFANAVRRSLGGGAARWWVVLMASQFHVVYYLTRTLPNMFAFGMTTLAFALLLPEAQPDKARALARTKWTIRLLIGAAAVFRSEVAILLATTSLYLLVTRRIYLRTLIPVFLIAFVAALAVSVPLDSYFWQKPLWPELWGFYFNAIQGSSSNWGVSPWHYYFTSALPRLLLNPVVPSLVVLALVHPGTTQKARILVIPNILYVAIYSFQPHKEARFIFYVVPPLTAAAALGANFISVRVSSSSSSSSSSKSVVYAGTAFVLVISVLAAFAGSTAMLLISSLNYPGGDALAQLYALASVEPPGGAPTATVSVHADVLTCMTGLTLLGQNPSGLPLALLHHSHHSSHASDLVFLFDKTETEEELQTPSFWTKFDYVLAEDPSKVLGDWEVVGVVHGYDGVEILKPGTDVPDMEANGDPNHEKVLGNGAVVAAIRDFVRKYTGGWWAGPRMSPRIRILKQIRVLGI